MIKVTKTEYGTISVGKPWVGLTDEEMLSLYNEYIAEVGLIGVFRAIGAKLKEKNT